MYNFICNLKGVIGSSLDDAGGSDLPVVILMIAGFSTAAIVIANFIGTATVNKAADVAACIEASSIDGLTKEDAVKKCNGDHVKKHSFKKDGTYKGRFGS